VLLEAAPLADEFVPVAAGVLPGGGVASSASAMAG